MLPKRGCRDFVQLFESKKNARMENPFYCFKYVYNGIHFAYLMLPDIFSHPAWMNSFCRHLFRCQWKWFCYVHFVNLVTLVLCCGLRSDLHPRTLNKSHWESLPLFWNHFNSIGFLFIYAFHVICQRLPFATVEA